MGAGGRETRIRLGDRVMGSSDEVSFDIAACRAHLQARQERKYRAREQRRQLALKALRAAARSVLPRFPGVRRAYLFGEESPV